MPETSHLNKDILNICGYLQDRLINLEWKSITIFGLVEATWDTASVLWEFRQEKWLSVINILLVLLFLFFNFMLNTQRKEIVEIVNRIIKTTMEGGGYADPQNSMMLFVQNLKKRLSTIAHLQWISGWRKTSEITHLLKKSVHEFLESNQGDINISYKLFNYKNYLPSAARRLFYALIIVFVIISGGYSVATFKSYIDNENEGMSDQLSADSLSSVPIKTEDILLYRMAITNACFANDQKICSDLVAIRNDNLDNFEPQVINGKTCIRVYSIKEKSYYSGSGFTDTNTEGRYNFVFLKSNFFDKYHFFQPDTSIKRTDSDSLLRVKQLLGLPPHNNYWFVFEYLVDTSRLFRPCPDMEISDCKCELSFPANSTYEHKVYMEKQQSNAYNNMKDSLNYPFTRLGYTYDWSIYSPDHVGVSEFIIKRNSPVRVKVYKIMDFLRRGNQNAQ